MTKVDEEWDHYASTTQVKSVQIICPKNENPLEGTQIPSREELKETTGDYNDST
jgi:hypothetical protein